MLIQLSTILILFDLLLLFEVNCIQLRSTGSCVDTDTDCRKWATKGQCVTQPEFITATCPNSCNLCSCEDSNAECSYWALNSQCDENPEFMKTYCRHSCNECTPVEPETESEAPTTEGSVWQHLRATVKGILGF